jgi:hypothetical protein
MPTLPSSSVPVALVWIAVAAVVAAALFVWMVLRKGRLRSGNHVFRASRWSRGNHLLPPQVLITPEAITLYQPQWIGKLEESIHMSHIASIKIDTHLIFSDIIIETSGGRDPILCHGHTKGDAVEMKRVIEQFQSEHYRNAPTSA